MKTTTEMIAVMQAYADGKKIEYKGQFSTNESWSDAIKPTWNWKVLDYRIKPEPKYRPYKDADEFFKAQGEHGMYVYFPSKCAYKLVTGVHKGGVAILWDSCEVEEIEYADLLKRATWQDSEPCGVKEE